MKTDQTLTRFGIIVTTKVSKKAVVRNKVKRRVREIIRQHLPQFKKGFDVIVFVLKGTEEKNFHEIKTALLNLFKKSFLLTND